jgi:DNA-binding PadR family transcriptional regulator
MGHRHQGCGPRGNFEFCVPEALLAMRGGRGWSGSWGPFTFDFGDVEGARGWGGGRRGRRTRRMFESGELRLVLLKLIADEPRHGYDLIRAIEELTGGEYAPSPGVVYPTLTLLQDMGLIEEAAGEGPRKRFEATDEGRSHLEERADEVEALFERLVELKPRSEQMAGPAIGRAIKNLMTALSHRVGRDGLDEELLHEIAAILDEAAQRIERVK